MRYYYLIMCKFAAIINNVLVMKKFFSFVRFFFLLTACNLTLTGQAASYYKYNAGGVSDIHPKGWLQTLLQRQHDGLTGHPEALSYPYNTCLWAGEISRADESYGANWWRYEQTAYYTDGLLRLGYEINADEMVEKAMEGIEYTLAHPDEKGVLGNSTLEVSPGLCRCSSELCRLSMSTTVMSVFLRHWSGIT